MRRVVSFVLVICIFISLLSTAFATGSVAQNQGTSYKYNLVATAVKDYSTVKDPNNERILDFTKFDSYDEMDETVTDLWAYSNTDAAYKTFYWNFLWF